MIDPENEVFTRVKKRITDEYGTGFNCGGSYSAAPAKLPALTVVMMDNTIYDAMRDSSGRENAVQVMFEISAYSNSAAGKKTECKKIIQLADEAMRNMGFTRIMLNPIPNLNDATVYKLTARYMGVVTKNNTVYRR